MEDDVERLRRQAEIRKRRLLERSSARMKLINPNYEESSNAESLESILDDGPGKSFRTNLIAKSGCFGDEVNNSGGSDHFNLSRASTSCTVPAFPQDGVTSGEEGEQQSPDSDLKMLSYVEYWNRKESDFLRKAGPCVLGVLLFAAHHFAPDSSSLLLFPVRTNSVSGIIAFCIYQLFIFQAHVYTYFCSLTRPSNSSSHGGNKVWCNFFLGCKNTQKLDKFATIHILIQYGFALRSLVSEWLYLVTFYFLTGLFSSPFIST